MVCEIHSTCISAAADQARPIRNLTLNGFFKTVRVKKRPKKIEFSKLYYESIGKYNFKCTKIS